MNQRGMTLLEVMVALLIFAITGAAILKTSAEHLNSLSQIEQVTFATWVANNTLSEVRYNEQWPPKNNARGEMDMAEITWYWRLQTAKTADSDLLAVTVSVGTNPDYESSVTAVTTYLAKPDA